jgi:hypothetical protein
MPLKWLNCGGNNQMRDLTPLAGTPLEFLCVNLTSVSDLGALKSMPLKQLLCSNSRVADLSPLRGMRLEQLILLNCKVSDLAPLEGMPLHTLEIKGTSVTDLQPLRALPLKTLGCEFDAKRDAPLLLPIKTLATINEVPAEQFWRENLFAVRLAALLRGEDQPADNRERLAFARCASDEKKYAVAARLWTEALASDPTLGDDRTAQHRYQAARAALLTAAGPGEGEPPLDDAARAKLRRQALDWLKAELRTWNERFDAGPDQDRPTILATLSAWRQDTGLAGGRDAAALAKLPAEEQKEWQALWTRVPDLKPVVAKSKHKEGQTWRYTTQQPVDGWRTPDFDDQAWTQGVGPFGSADYSIRTPWKTDDIWLRREFTLSDGKADELFLHLDHDDDAEVYINGVLALQAPGCVMDTEVLLNAEARAALKPGKNLVAVHCHNIGGPQLIDAGLVAVNNNAARLAVAQIARDRRDYTFAAQLWTEALARDPTLADDRLAQHRYRAARAAALAPAGQGVDAAALDDAARARWRQQAFEWLKAEFAAWSDVKDARDRAAMIHALSQWRTDTDLSSIRDAWGLTKLPAEEQKRFTQLWADVAAHLSKKVNETLAKHPEDPDAAGALAGLLLEKAEAKWHTLKPSAVKSEGGATLTVQPDDSVLASGAAPDKDVYVIEAPAAGNVRAIRLDVLPDSSMVAGGSGRAATSS